MIAARYGHSAILLYLCTIVRSQHRVAGDKRYFCWKASAIKFVGYIILKIRNGRMFPDAPTFAFRVACMYGLSSSVMLIIAKISSGVSPLSLAGDCVTVCARSSFGYPCRRRD